MCMAVLDTELNVLEANTELLRLFDRPARIVLGQSLAVLLHPSVQEQVVSRFGQLVMGRREHLETRAVLLQGTNSAFSGLVTAVAVDSGLGDVSSIVVLVIPDEPATTAVGDAKTTLTELDARILEGVAAGIATTQLASQLYLSKQGVEYHVSIMLRRFSVPNRAALVAKAYSTGMFSIGTWPPKLLVGSVR